MIRIVNLKNYTKQNDEILIKIDRTTPLGNPFFMRDESQRDQVCDEYEEYFNNKIKIQHPTFMTELNRILEIAKKKNVALGCWCKEEECEIRCHGDTVKKYLDNQLNEV